MKRYNFLLLILYAILFVIPFFWMKPGEVDLGGDASRLYFYDPLNYLKNVVLYSILPIGQGVEYSYIFTLPFILLLSFLKQIFNSPSLLINLFNGFALSSSFLFIYLIITELLKFNNVKSNRTYISLAAIIGGLFYIFIPISFNGGWDKALLDFPLFFLNPFFFLLVLKFIHTENKIYLLIFIIISFIFSTNYSYASSPKFLSFYPLAMIFFIIYALFIIRKRVDLKVIIFFSFLFILVQMFHLLPTVAGLFKENTFTNTKVFSNIERAADIKYFQSLSSTVKITPILLAGASSFFFLSIYTLIFPSLIVVGAILNTQRKKWRNNSKIFLLLLIFFLITFFFTAANITEIGKSFYLSLFYLLPGFTMFRSFVGQWVHSLIFYYALLLAFSFFYIFSSFKGKFKYLLYFFVVLLLTVGAKNFITGDVSNRVLVKNNGVDVKSFFKIDPDFEKSLSYLRNLKTDSKNLTLPLTGHFYQVLGGTGGGAYIGPSVIAYLSGKHDFGSSTGLDLFAESVLKVAKNKNYEAFNNIFPLFNIHYVFYNSDPYIMENFPDFPYEQMLGNMPKSQSGYKTFIDNLSIEKQKDFGEKYHIYKVSENLRLPHIYIAKEYVYLNPDKYTEEYVLNNYLTNDNKELRKVFMDKSKVKNDIQSFKDIPKIEFQKINPAKYEIKVSNASKPYVLVFLEAFNNDWKLFLSDKKEIEDKNSTSYFNGEIVEKVPKNIFIDKNTFETWSKKPVSHLTHFQGNFYANAWYIKPSDTGNKNEYTFILEMTSQRFFYVGLLISFSTFLVCLSVLCMILFQSIKRKIKK